jgi:predicted ATP-binding protein involved in virulence
MINLFLEKENVTILSDGFEIDIQSTSIDEITTFFKLYEELEKDLGTVDRRSINILDIRSNKKLSTGEKGILDLYASIYDYLKRFRDHQYQENCIFLFDEADLGFHPDWKKKYLNTILNTLPLLLEYKEKIENIQIIFSTHDPLTLSDVPNGNVIYLKKENNKTKILNHDRPQKSFGANITDLLADSFFIKGGLMGDFAKHKINEVIDFLSDEKRDISKKERIKSIIDIIDEPLLKHKLKEMFYEAFEDERSQEREIKELKRLAEKYNFKIEPDDNN